MTPPLPRSMTLTEAKIFVKKNYRHHNAPVGGFFEPDKKTYCLYEIDLGSEKITPLKIPKLKFEAPS